MQVFTHHIITYIHYISTYVSAKLNSEVKHDSSEVKIQRN